MMFRNGLLLAVTFVALATPALSADPHRLAFSERLGVEVFALPDDTGNWCRTDLELALALKDDSALVKNGVEGFVPKLAPVFDQECPVAEKAVIQAYKAKDREPVGTTYSATKSGQWLPEKRQETQVSASVSPPPPLPKPVQKPSKPLATQAYDATDWNLLIGYAQVDSAFLTDENTVKAYAANSDCDTFSAMLRNEFKIQDYLDKTKANLQSQAASQKPYVRVSFDAELGQYDPSKGAFAFDPLSKRIGMDVSYIHCSQTWRLPVRNFVFSWKSGNGIYGLPLAQNKAEAYVEKIVNDYWTKRAIHLEVISKPTFLPVSSEGIIEVQLQILEVRAFESGRNPKLLHTYTEDELIAGGKALEHAHLEEVELKRKLAAAQEQEQRLKERLQQANNDYTRLSKYATRREKIAYLNGDKELIEVSWSIGASLANNNGYPSTFLVKAGGHGRANVNAAWPQRLTINLPQNLPELKEGNWYVLSGRVKAQPHEDGAMPIGLMNVEIATECQQDMCGEAENVVTMIQNRYPDLDWQPAKQARR